MNRAPFPTNKKLRIMLDSGAYSAWVKGTVVNLREYVSFIKKYEHLLHSYVNLDVIPGQQNRFPTAAEVEESAVQGLKNFEYMRSCGLDPIPVYHQGEQLYFLEKFVNECNYIGLSGGGYMRSSDLRREGLDRAFTLITHEDGTPKVKTHGFAVMNTELIHRYPWTSCDATSWVVSAGHGSVTVPQWNSGIADYDYFVSPLQLVVSEREERLNIPGSLNILGSETKKHVLNYFALRNTSVEKLQKRSERIKLNAAYFLEVEKRHCTERFSHRQNYLFNGSKITKDGSVLQSGLNIFWAGEDLRRIKISHSNILVSYYELRDMGPMNLQTFVDLEWELINESQRLS